MSNRYTWHDAYTVLKIVYPRLFNRHTYGFHLDIYSTYGGKAQRSLTNLPHDAYRLEVVYSRFLFDIPIEFILIFIVHGGKALVDGYAILRQ